MTETSITTTEPQGLTIPQSKYELVRNMCAKNCTDDEFELLIALANKYGLKYPALIFPILKTGIPLISSNESLLKAYPPRTFNT